MKIIRKKDIAVKKREDRRTVCYYPPFDIPQETKQIGFITVDTPQNCNEKEHVHPVSTEIFYHVTSGKVQVNNVIYDLNEGDIMILEPGDHHKQIAEQDIVVVVLRIPFSSDKKIVMEENYENY